MTMPIIKTGGKVYRHEKTVKFWECHASNGMFGPTRHDDRDRQTCGHKHKSKATADKCAASLKRYKRRRWIPIECHRVLYKEAFKTLRTPADLRRAIEAGPASQRKTRPASSGVRGRGATRKRLHPEESTRG